MSPRQCNIEGWIGVFELRRRVVERNRFVEYFTLAELMIGVFILVVALSIYFTMTLQKTRALIVERIVR